MMVDLLCLAGGQGSIPAPISDFLLTFTGVTSSSQSSIKGRPSKQSQSEVWQVSGPYKVLWFGKEGEAAYKSSMVRWCIREAASSRYGVLQQKPGIVVKASRCRAAGSKEEPLSCPKHNWKVPGCPNLWKVPGCPNLWKVPGCPNLYQSTIGRCQQGVPTCTLEGALASQIKKCIFVAQDVPSCTKQNWQGRPGATSLKI